MQSPRPSRPSAESCARLRRLALGLILSSSLLSAAAAAESRGPVKVFLLAGQSNLSGRAQATALPPAERAPINDILFDYVCSFGTDSKPGQKEAPQHSNGWIALQPQPKHPGMSSDHFGPEIGFGRALLERWPGARIAIIKHGRGSTNLAEEWAPDATKGPQLYRQFLAQSRNALERLRVQGIPYEIAAFVWCQGEGDSTRQEWAVAYGSNLKGLIARVRSDFGLPTLPVLIALSLDGKHNPRMKFPSEIRAAQREVVKNDPHSQLVSGDDLTLGDGIVHFDAASQLTLGRRLAAAYLAMAP